MFFSSWSKVHNRYLQLVSKTIFNLVKKINISYLKCIKNDKKNTTIIFNRFFIENYLYNDQSVKVNKLEKQWLFELSCLTGI